MGECGTHASGRSRCAIDLPYDSLPGLRDLETSRKGIEHDNLNHGYALIISIFEVRLCVSTNSLECVCFRAKAFFQKNWIWMLAIFVFILLFLRCYAIEDGAEWFAGAATIFIGGVAVFQTAIHGYFFKPEFKVRIECEPPDCHMTKYKNNTSSLYLQIFVENIGKKSATNVEVYANKLQKFNGEKWENVSMFPPLNLRWSYVEVCDIYKRIYFRSLSPRMGKHCTIGHITNPAAPDRRLPPGVNASDPRTFLEFDFMSYPNHNGHIIGPGKYRLLIQVAAENADPKEDTLEIEVKGTWFSSEDDMLRDGVTVKIIR